MNAGSYTFTVTNVQHPNYANAIAGDPIAWFTIDLMNFGTNTILDEALDLPITNLNAGFSSQIFFFH